MRRSVVQAVRPTAALISARPTPSALARAFSTTSAGRSEALRTPLYDFHVQNKARMVPFAGWSMPLSYGEVGQVAAHNHVRSSAGLFDVSHMVQHTFSGLSVQDFLMSLTPSSLNGLAPFSSTLSVILNEEGGIIDDTVITKHSDESFYVVTNAGRAAEDKAHFETKLEEWNAKEGKGKEVKWEVMDGWGLVALQGPKAAEVLQGLTNVDLTGVKFGQSVFAEVDGVKCHIARGGYTGEDGFEVSIPPEHAVAVTQKIASQSDVQLIGLGARDSLRLEAGMCLYGNDLDESVSPVEAGLTWVIGKDRRSETAAPFPGRSRILEEIANGPKRRRVGIEIMGSPAREGCKVFDSAGVQEIGIITSGIPSPTLGANIAMGYVASGQHKKGTAVKVEVRKKMRDAVVRPMPFVPSKYYK